MRRFAVVLSLVVVVGALAYAWRENEHEDCPTIMRFEDVTYAVYEVSQEIPARDEIGVGTEHGCGDNGPWSETVAVNRIAGVDPGTALVTAVAADVLYLAEDVTLDELPSRLAELVVE